MSRFDLGQFDGEDVLNGEIKVGAFKITDPTRYMVGDRIHVALELVVGEKNGIAFVYVDNTLTRRHNAKPYRAAVVEDDQMLDTIAEWWLARPLEADEAGTEPMFDRVGGSEPTNTVSEHEPAETGADTIIDTTAILEGDESE